MSATCGLAPASDVAVILAWQGANLAREIAPGRTGNEFLTEAPATAGRYMALPRAARKRSQVRGGQPCPCWLSFRFFPVPLRLVPSGFGTMDKNIIERAFELAPSCSTINELRSLLTREGYEFAAAHLSGLGLQRELRRLYNNGEGTRKRGPKPRADH